jgi:hypothetical protein
MDRADISLRSFFAASDLTLPSAHPATTTAPDAGDSAR